MPAVRAHVLLGAARRLLRLESTTWVEVFAVWTILAWAGCLAAGHVYERTGTSLRTMAALPEQFWACVAGLVAAVPIALFLLGDSRHRHWGGLSCALFFGALAGLIGSESIALPAVWIYAGLGLICLVPFWRRYA